MTRALLIISLLLLPAATQGATYYVGKHGSDSASCNQARSLSTAKLTIAAGLRCLAAGDTLAINGGTYTEGIAPGSIPSGISKSAQTIVKAAAGQTVVINGFNSLRDGLSIYDRSYIVIDGLIFDGFRIRIGGNGPRYSHHITVQNSTIANTVTANYSRMSQSCVTQQGPGGANTHIIFINNEIYNCGPETGHGIYLSARDSLVEGNRIYNNAKFGIHMFSQSGSVNNNIIRYNHVYNNGSFGILVGSGANNKVYGNTVRDNALGGIEIGFRNAEDNRVYDNQIYRNTGDCIRIKRDVYHSKLSNNTCWENGNDTVLNQGIATDLSHGQ
jgi:parallel beta-helix repeat protein